jgi:uncharacterized membrane protein YphA (DoxX/SURF4 family)
MNTALWIAQGILAFVFFGAAIVKLTQSREQMIRGLGQWVQDYPAWAMKATAIAEVLAAIGLIVPAAANILPVLVPLAAVGLVVVMAGGIVVHTRHGEYSKVVVNIVLAACAIFVAWGRFGPYRF